MCIFDNLSVDLRGQFPGKGLLQDGLLEFGEGGEFLLVDGFEVLGFFKNLVPTPTD